MLFTQDMRVRTGPVPLGETNVESPDRRVACAGRRAFPGQFHNEAGRFDDLLTPRYYTMGRSTYIPKVA